MRTRVQPVSEPAVTRQGALPWTVAGLLAVVLLIGGGLLAGPLVKSPAHAAADAAPPPASPILVAVEKRKLSNDIVFRGMVLPGKNLSLSAPQALMGSSPVITKTPAGAGSRMQSGTLLLEANGEPVFTMDWNFPPYRSISAGMTGPDVLQLQATLDALGYPTVQNSVMDRQTQNSLSRFYLDRGYAPPTGPGNSAEPVPAAGGDATGAEPAAASRKATGTQEPPGVHLPAEAIVTIPSAQHTLSALKVAVGDTLSAESAELAVLDASAPIVVAALQPDAANVLAKGDTALLADDRNGKAYPLRVDSVGTTPEEVPGIGTGMKVQLSFTKDTADITAEGATQRLTTAAGGSTEAVLAVPVTAIYTQADGSTHLTLADGTSVPVMTGKNVDGWVEIIPDVKAPITEGDQVVVGLQSAR